MGKMNELSMIIDNLIACGETLAATGRALKDFYSQADEAAPAEKLKGKKAPNAEKKNESKAPAAAEPQYSKEDVRGILAKKASEAGGRFKTEVKALVRKYGNGGSLTDVPAESYPALVKEAEGLTDG